MSGIGTGRQAGCIYGDVGAGGRGTGRGGDAQPGCVAGGRPGEGRTGITVRDGDNLRGRIRLAGGGQESHGGRRDRQDRRRNHHVQAHIDELRAIASSQRSNADGAVVGPTSELRQVGGNLQAGGASSAGGRNGQPVGGADGGPGEQTGAGGIELHV